MSLIRLLSLLAGFAAAASAQRADAPPPSPASHPTSQRSTPQSPIADEVVLRTGRVVEGRLVSDTADAVVLEFPFGGTVAFKRDDVRSVTRRLGPTPDRGAPAREEFRYLVYHGDTIVGYRRVSKTSGLRRDGRVGVLWRDEVKFHEASDDDDPLNPTHCRVVILEFRASSGDYRRLYYREAGLGTDNIVDGVWRDGRLEYTWIRGGKRSYHETTFDAAVSFPTEMWFAANAVAVGETRRTRVWDPRVRKLVAWRARAIESRRVTLGGRALPVTLVECTDPRGRRLRWVGRKGRALKEILNGRSLVAVETRRRRVPVQMPDDARVDVEERRRLRVVLDPRSGATLRIPSVGWQVAERPDGAFELMNAEADATIEVYWCAGADAPWPGPSSDGVSVRPERFGGFAGQGWSDEPAPDRRRIVRRRTTASGRVVAVLDAPREMLPSMRVDLQALLTESTFR